MSWMLLFGLLLLVTVVGAAFFTPEDVPGPPEKILVSPASDSSMRVQFSPPLNVKPEGVNGAPVLGYKVDVARRVDEVQTFSVAANGPILAGAYKLQFGAQMTPCIPWNASDVELEMALEELPTVDSVGVSRSAYSAAKNGYVYTITFDGAYLGNGKQTDTLDGDTTGCPGTQPPNRVLSFEGLRVATGVPGYYPEVWEVVSTNTGTQLLGGTFDLSVGFEGDWVATHPAITATVAAGSRTAKASMLGVVNRGDRVRIGGEEFTVHTTAPFTDSELPLDSYHVRGASAVVVEIMDTALGNVQVTKTSNDVATSSDFSSKLAARQQVRIGTQDVEVASITANTITLVNAWTGASTLHVTAYARKKATLSANAEAADMKRALGALPGVGTIDVSRVGPTKSNGYRWYVTFESLDSGNCPTSPCFRVDKKTGTSNFVDVYGAACTTCTVTASIVEDESRRMTLNAIKGDFAATAIVASREVGGVVAEVQSISTEATTDDISGSFAVSFQTVGGAVINFDDTAVDVRTKLQSLATVGRLNVTRVDNSEFGATWTITFLSNLGDLPLLVVDDETMLRGTGVSVVVQELVKGVDVAFETIIDGLVPGQEYFVRAYARNENGYGTSTTELQQRGRGALPLLASVATSPEAPGITGMWPLSGSQMELRLSSPVDHGDPVSKYLFEYVVGDTFGKPAIKKLYIYNSLENDIAGTFRLQYGDDVSSKLSVHSTASTLESALNSLPSLRPVSVTRALCVLTGQEDISFSTNNNRLTTTTPLTASQCKLLLKSVRIDVGGHIFTVRVQPAEGSSYIDVELSHVKPDFTEKWAVLKLDGSGSELGPYGYAWTISFDNVAEDVVDSKYPGLQLVSSLTSVKTGSAAEVTHGIDADQHAAPAQHYGYFEINNDERVCDTYVVGAPSSVQVVRLFGPTTATGGTFTLKLGIETTDCISLGKTGTASTIQSKLIALDVVDKVTVEEVRAFKVILLAGSATSKVTDYDNTGMLTVASALTQNQVDVLPKDTIIQVSRNPNDFSRHSCEFTVTTPPALGTTKISVSPAGSCDFFTGEARSLKILDFHDYNVRFWGHYPTGEWPTLQFDSASFGAAPCDPWVPSLTNLPVYGQVHTVKYEGSCSKGQAGIQTILADASSIIGGTFTLSYLGEVTSPLSFKNTGAAEMRDAIDSITVPGTVNVSVSQYGAYGKAWHVTFAQEETGQDSIFIQHARLTGQNALISVYPTVTVFTDAKQDDISGSFRIWFGGETTEAIGFSATHMKVTQELQKLSAVDSVLALGDKTAGDIGVYSLELTADAVGSNQVLSNIRLGGVTIDPTRFLAIGETLVVDTDIGGPRTIQSMTPLDITLTTAFAGTTAQNLAVLAGLITKQIKPLPGYVSITRLTQVVAVSKDSKTFELPRDHGFSVNGVFFVGGSKFKVITVAGAIVTTDVAYAGDSVVSANPKVYLFDNKLQTTEDLTSLVTVGDELWLPSVSADMSKYTIDAKDPRYLTVKSGSFSDSIVRTRAYHISNGRRWNLVFRSYDGSLDTIDVIPEHDWRGTEARIGTRSPNAAFPNVVNVGNPVATQTILLEVIDASAATTYSLSFASEARAGIPWSTLNGDLKTELEKLDSVDGVSVTSIMRSGTVIHTISFWGSYPMKKIPLLVATPASDNLKVYVRGNDAVAVTKQNNLILESSQTYAFRIFAENAKGISDSVSVFQVQTSTSSVVPTPPTGVALGEFHGSTWLSINYWAPFYSGGARVTMYRIEWDSSPNFDSSSIDYGVASIQEKKEVQHVTTSYRSSVGVGGTFTLSWGGHTTAALPFDCNVADMTDALAIITDTTNVAVDPVKVTRARVSWGYAWKITFSHNPGDLAPLVADGTQLTGDFPRISVVEAVQGFCDLAIGDFTHEVQEVFTDGVSVVDGAFTLTFGDKTTGTISVSASALEMQAALQAITTLYSIKVTKAIRNKDINTAIWSVTFAYLRGEEMVGAGNIFTMTVADSQLSGTSAVVRVANKVTGSDPFRFYLTDLRPGVKYYAHVMAYNADGFGSATSPLSTAVTCGQPQPPQSVIASVVDGTTLALDWSASTVDGDACRLDKYKVEWFRAEGTLEQQIITTSAGKGLPEIQRLVDFADSRTLSGYFKLSFGGEATENLQWDAAAVGLNSVKERLERLSTIGTVDVSRLESTRVSTLFVTATGKIVMRHPTLSTSTMDETNLAKDDKIWIAGNQRTITATPTATTITIDTDLEVTIPVPVFKSAYGYEWKITFLAGHVGPQELIQVYPSDSWTGNNPGIFVDSIQKGLQPISGTFRVAFASGGVSDTTRPLPHNISAIDLQTALESLVTIGGVNVTKTTNGYGYNWVITFLSEFKNDVSLLSVDGTELQGPGARVLSAQTLGGIQPSFYCEQNEVPGSAAEVTLPGKLHYVIPKLKTGQKYAIRVRAHNSEGFGYATSINPSFQIPRSTPSVPQDVELLVLSRKYLKLRWSAPLNDGGTAILGYRIQWDTSSTFSNVDIPNYDFQTVVEVGSTNTGPYFYNIFTPVITTYYVRVLALNDQGAGSYVLPVPKYARPTDRTPGRPEDTTATVLSSYAIMVEWKPPSIDKYYYGGDGGVSITQYMIEWDTSPAFDSPASFGLVDETKRSFMIGGDDAITGVRSDILIASSSYSIRVTAFNAKGAGAPCPTVPSSVVVTNQSPSAPQNFTLSVISATSVKAEWINPLFDGGASLKFYQIEWDEQDDFSSGHSSSATISIVQPVAPIPANSYVIPNLLAGSNYYVHVAALTDIGIGAFTPSASIEPSGSALAVQNIDAGYALYEREVQEIRLAASHITEIQEITTEAASIPEVQTLQTYASPELCPTGACITGSFAFRVPTVQTVTISADAAITGTFTLLFEREVSDNAGAFTKIGAVTAAINWDADAGTVKDKLTTVANSALAATDIVVTRDGDASPEFGYGYVFQVTFIGNSVAGETLSMTCTPSFTTVGNVASRCSVAMNTNMAMGTDTMVQEVIVTAEKPLVVGSYKLGFDHLGLERDTACIPFDASADDMKTKLEELPNIDHVFVTREAYADKAAIGFVYRIFFHGNGVRTAVNKLEGKSTGCSNFQTQENNVLTEVGVVGTVETSIVDKGGFDAGNTFVAAAANAVTSTAAQLSTDLNRLPIFGNVLVTRSLVDDQGGCIWTVAFEESEGNLRQFICAVDANFKAGTVCKTDTLTDGNVLSGSFFIGASSPIPFNADAAQIENELEAMGDINTVQVKRSAPSPQFGYTWTITFVDYDGDAPPLLVTSSLVGTGSRISVREVRKGNALSGTFTLSYLTAVTAPIKWNALETAAKSTSDGSSLQEKLEALDVVGRVSVQRSGPGHEGGYSWLVTFLDNVLNSGDLPLLQGNASMLTGEGAVVFTREVTKGSNAVGDQLWLSFDPPASDNGSPITKYQVRWDTSSKFTANPAEVFITDADVLYRTQRITTSAPSLAWSSNMIQPTASAVQKLTILAAGTFTLKFRGVDTTTLTAGPTGASTIATLESALEQLSSVGSVDISSAATTLAVTAEFQITFTAQPGALPLLVPDSNTIASVGEVQAGTTNFRKEIVVFSCTATKGTVKFTYKGEDDDTIKFDAKLADVEAELLAFIGVEADSISVSSVPAQTMLCSTANPADIIIVFHRVYGDISLGIAQGTTDSDAVITPNTAASVDGVYNDNPALTMSGTLQVGYQGLYTRPLNAESSADQLRYALENLDTIQTVDVARDRSYQVLSGKVDVTEGEIFVTCSAGEMCNFYSAAYGLPGYFIRVGGDWYTVLTDGSSPGLHNTRLYLGDLSGRETGYKGSTQISVTVYEWTKGYVWTVDMLSVASPLGYLRAKVPRLYPADSVVQIYGSACTKCYYLPTQTTKKLTMGQQYNIEVYAYNFNGKGAAPGGGPITATPMQVPGPPSNVDLLVVSGHEIEVFFSPPALATSNMSPDFNKDISSYIVQWDLDSTFKHGLSVCTGCVTSLTNFMLTVTTALTTFLPDGSKFTISELGCVLEVSQVLSTTVVQVDGHHTCDNFNSRSYSITYYTFPPEEIGGALIQGSPPFRYLISSLVVATKYFVRVAAVNSVPVQQIAPNGVPPDNRQWSTPLSVLTKDRAPDAPLSVALYPFAGTILQLQIQPSIRDGKGTQGAAISAFWIDVDTVSTFDSATKSPPIEVLATSALIPELYTGGPRIYYLTGLTTGTRYFAQVKVKNSIGYSRATLAPAPVAPIRHSDGPINAKVSTVTVSPNPIDSATVTWQRPAFNGGLGLTSYKIEWWCAQSRPEVQVVELKWKTTPTKAPFSLLFGGGESEDLDMDSSPENLRSALMNIAAGGILTIGHVEVSRTTLNSGLGYQWTITFDNVNLNAGNQRLLQMEIGTVVGSQDVSGNVYELTSGINVPALPTFPGKSEVQVLVTYHATTTVGGFFRLGYKGSAWTNYLPATISAANLKLALETLPTIGVVNVNLELMASAGNAFVIGQVWTITFISNVGNLPPLIVEPSKLTPADAFLGVKDGDNAVDGSGVLCLPGGDIACPGSWPVGIADLRQQALPQKSVVELAVVGEAAVGYAFYETLDAATLTHTISPLIPGQAYFVAVTAKNALGLGIRAQTSPTSVIPPLQVPGPPTNVAVDVNPGVATQLVATWGAPTSDGGNPVRMYRIEYDPSPMFTNRGQQDAWCPVAPTTAVWRVQTKRTSADTTAPIGSGYFTLQLTRRNTPEPSEPIPWNAVATTREELGSAVVTNSKVFCTVASPTCTSKSVFPFGRLEKSGSMQSKLNYFASISAGVDVARSTVAATGGSYTWSITFLDTKDDFALAVKDVKLTCSDPLTCTMGTYDVLVAKVRSGVLPPSCVGSRIVPSIGALNKGQLYNLRVSAYNEVGFGKAGAAPNPQKPMVVPGPSTAVTLEVYSVSELVVLFSPPDDNGGDTVTAYELQWAIDSAFTIPSSVIVTIMSGVRAPYRRVISSLTKGTPYFVQIRARNSQGFGQFQLSSPTKMQPYTTPSAPTQVALGITSATMLTVRWAPPSDDGGDTISAYVVQWDVAAGFDSLALTMGTTVTVNDPAQRSYTITGLTPGTLYYVRVFAKNRGGQGTPQTSTPSSLVPAVTDPGKPNTLTIETTLVTGELRISWLAPQIPAHGYPCAGTLQVPGSCPVVGATNMVFGGVDLKEYVVQYSEMSDFRIPTEQTTTALTVLLTGLDSSKTYYAQVYAVNSQGLKSAFCKRANTQSLLCPDQQVLLDSSVVTGDFVYAQPL